MCMKDMTQQIVKLRKRGLSYREISEATGSSKSNISFVCNKYVHNNKSLSSENNSTVERNYFTTKEGYNRYVKKRKDDAIENWHGRLLDSIPLLELHYLAGLFDGEASHSGPLKFSNSNASIIEFVKGVLDRLLASYKTYLNTHSKMDAVACKEWWESKGINIDVIVKQDTRRTSSKPNSEYKGTVHINIHKPLGLREAIQKFSFMG